MARDGMLPPAVAAIHPRFKTPLITTMITGVAVAILALIVPLNNLLNLVNIGTLIAFSVVCAGVLYFASDARSCPAASASRSFRSSRSSGSSSRSSSPSSASRARPGRGSPSRWSAV